MATAARRPHGCHQRWEVADVLRDHAHRLRLSQSQLHAVQAIVACRTDKLGGTSRCVPTAASPEGATTRALW